MRYASNGTGTTRRLLNLLTALSLLLCVAVCVLWVRSQWSRDKVVAGRGVTFVGVESSGGEFGLYWDTDASPVVTATWRGPEAGGFRASTEKSMGGVADLVGLERFSELGIALDDYDIPHTFAVPGGNASTHRRVVTVPYAYPLVASAALPAAVAAARVARLRRSRRAAAGFCPTCGYDLRATPGRCPECGAVVARASQ